MCDTPNGCDRTDSISANQISNSIRSAFNLPDTPLNQYSPLTFAYIGDSIYALVAKTVLVEKSNCPAKELHNMTVKYVSAPAQAKIVRYLMDNDVLTDEEADVLRRGRNAKASSTAKNASVGDYRLATGLEALVGYLYMDGQMDRLLFILKKGFDMLDGLEISENS